MSMRTNHYARWGCYLSLILTSALSWFSHSALAKDGDLRPLVVYLNTSLESIPDRSRLRSLQLVVHAFYELGYSISFGFQPPKRMIESMHDGKIDVMCLRASGMEKLRENILRVPVSVHHLRLYGYIEKSRLPKSGLWRDVSVETVGLSHGAQLPERYIPEELLKRRFIRPPDSITGARLVRAGRIDMVILPEIFYHATEPVEHEVLSGLVKLEPELGSIETYCFLSRKHEHLLEPLGAALNRLKYTAPAHFDDSSYPMVISDQNMKKIPSLPYDAFQ